MTTLHLDFWTADSTALNVFLISPGPSETPHALPITQGGWVSVDIPLTEFAGVDLTQIIQFKFDGNGTIFLDNLYFSGGDAGEGEGVEVTVNGDFETGDTTGWTSFATDNNGSFAITDAQANGGTYSGNLVAGVPAEGGPASFPVIKQANIGVGTVTPNTSVTISFDLYGSMAGDGGVVFAEFFSELGAGGVSQAEILGGGPIAPSGTWTNYRFTTTTGSDVSGGVTLQLKADCGANAGCMIDAYFDNVSVTVESDGGDGGTTGPTVAAPTPTEPEANVISVFSDAYQNISGVDYNPNWGQATVVTTESIAGNTALKYAGLDYQGTDFSGNPQDISGMTSLRLDFWTADSTGLDVYLISPGPSETAYALPVTQGGWVSVDIPLTEFAGVDLTDVIQFKFVGDGTLFLDNLYFVGDGGGDGATGDDLNDFEGDPASYLFTDFDGGVASIIDNPQPTGINTSARVGQMQKFAGQPWGGSTLALDGVIDIPPQTVITLLVWSQRPVPVLFKLEGMNVERSAEHSGGGWEELSFDFSGDTGAGVPAVTLIFDLGVEGDAAGDPLNWTFYFDDMILPESSGGGTDPGEFQLTAYGAGNISDTINPDGYRCVVDFGNWIYNAGVVEPAIAACDESTGIPTGTPTRLHPQLTGPAESNPTPTHKWWGSIGFLGEMAVGDPNQAGHITPDPITARITERGVRVMGIPAGLATVGDNFYYPIPDPFSEVFDGVAIGNTAHANLQGYLMDHSDGSVTVQWQSGGQAVMEATFVHGSPYIYFKAFDGELVVRTLRSDGGEKGTFYNQGDSLGIWTSVAGNHNNFLVTGEGATTFSSVSGSEITVSNAANELTLTLLPHAGSAPPDALTGFFEARARDVVAAVRIDHSVDRSSNTVTVSHTYLDALGAPIETLAGMHPLHWKNSTQPTSGYQVRSARGTIKFSQTDQFSYEIPYVGVLPALPSIAGSFDQPTLENLVTEFVAQGPAVWNDRTDVYWSGKNYSKVAELIAIAESIGMNTEATQLRDWLKSELEDWFAADTNGSLDINKYFAYDDEWNTLLGLEESFLSHQQLNDHHFHYGYLVRAAAEICRVDAAWCGDDQYGPMIELLIRDYAGGRDDPMFPYLRNFDPANGFSWASGMVNFARGNNNESTSEAANAYGAIVLYGMITGKEDLVERGMYLHASTSAAYWEYWNNIDGYNNVGADEDNFPADYDRITTSIIWGDGAVFSTWFSGAFAHILGIQGLPTNPLVFHVGLNPVYMADYVSLGLSESSNGKPSGLVPDQWRDIWWNLWSMIDGEAAIWDYDTVASYTPEAGETKAHTYHWMHTFANLGHLITGTGELTADHPAAVAFDKDGVITYVVYNFSDQAQTVIYSDGQIVDAAPNGFTVVTF